MNGLLDFCMNFNIPNFKKNQAIIRAHLYPLPLPTGRQRERQGEEILNFFLATSSKFI